MTLDEDQNVPALPVCLTIAGSDSGGGAGVQADLRAFYCCDCFGVSVVTCITAQNPHAVHSIHPVPVPDVVAQFRAVKEAFRIGAVKTGMLYSAEIIRAVAFELAELSVPIIVDPVMVAGSGNRLLRDDAVAALRQELLPLAAVVTPNLPEAEVLLGRRLDSSAACREAALELAGCGFAVLLKGGHHSVEPGCDWYAKGETVCRLETPNLKLAASHGTGCTLSSVLAAFLASGHDELDAAVAAKAFVWQALANPRRLGPETTGIWPALPLDTSCVRRSVQ